MINSHEKYEFSFCCVKLQVSCPFWEISNFKQETINNSQNNLFSSAWLKFAYNNTNIIHNISPQSTFLIKLMIANLAQSFRFIINEVLQHQFCCSLKRLMFIIYIDALYSTFATERVVMIWLLVFVNYASLLHSIWSERNACLKHVNGYHIHICICRSQFCIDIFSLYHPSPTW